MDPELTVLPSFNFTLPKGILRTRASSWLVAVADAEDGTCQRGLVREAYAWARRNARFIRTTRAAAHKRIAKITRKRVLDDDRLAFGRRSPHVRQFNRRECADSS